MLCGEQMTCGYVIQLDFHLEESCTLPTLKWLATSFNWHILPFASGCAHRHVLAESGGIYLKCISISNMLKVCNAYAGHHSKYIWPQQVSWILDMNLFCSYSWCMEGWNESTYTGWAVVRVVMCQGIIETLHHKQSLETRMTSSKRM